MGRGKLITPEKAEQIKILRKTGMSRSDIAKELGVSPMSVTRYSRDVEDSTPELVETGVRCEQCGEPLPKRARFCFICGTKIMSEREKLALRVSTLRRIYSVLPEAMRDEAVSVLNDVLAYLDKEENGNVS